VLQVSLGGNWSTVTLPAGTHAVYAPALGSGSTVIVRRPGPALPGSAFPGSAFPGSVLCVTGVTVGSLHPYPAGQAIPAAPVPG
jgi:hypothetical protein